jgi:mRNA-degrading endonuclease toxin of MazEF toxin-antitoxin module
MAHQPVRGQSSDIQIKMCNSVRRGHVLMVDLRGSKGSEMAGNHTCVVVSNDVLNKGERTLVVVPITSHGGSGKTKPYEVGLKAGDGELEKDCAAVPHLVRTIMANQDRIIEIWGVLSDGAMRQIENMLIWALSKPAAPVE